MRTFDTSKIRPVFANTELWLDFETWLYKNHNVTLSDLSWNTYVEYSKQYNNERKNA